VGVHDDVKPESTAIEPLAGGSMNAVVRVGDTVRRPAGPWTPTIHRLLRHLRARGIDWVPRPLELTDDGREALTYLPGAVPRYPMPSWVWSDAVLLEAVARLAAFHDAGRDFDGSGAVWQLPPHEPAEVICHNDFAPYNLVFDDERALVGLIDCDVASPGPRVWDLAYLAYRLVPLGSPGNPDALDSDPGERRRRLDLLCETYGHDVDPSRLATTMVARLHELARFTAARVGAGAPHLIDHVQLYRDDANWLVAHFADFD
jgi:hypothetical protein